MNRLRNADSRAKALGLWLLALLCDYTDRRIAALVSGHAVQHILAALTTYRVVLHLKRRRVL
jgi:branched-subunit amino acid transport protein AzlD